ncbi:MAG TPA: LacI family DNA-binding transcriptional regulator [Mycobacteriales bacterium]|nr:LacI family DNA-binding transcriptional regulator [Mycobacteriales bacterium]
MRSSLRDVAKLAGVSVKTVSNVVNDYPHVTTRTRDKVQRALEELSYRPNISARHLRSGKSGVIALAVPDLSSPYFAELASAVTRAAAERSFTVFIDQTDGDPALERRVVSGLGGRLIDGVILSPLALTDDDIAAAQQSMPVVLLGERVAEGPADHVAIDSAAAAREAVEHLVSLGRRRIAAIGYQGFETGETARLRAAGYEAALRDAGLEDDPDLHIETESYHRADGAAGMARLLALPEPPDAVLGFNDLLALGAVRALHEAGKAVPGDVAVIGIDDIEDGRFSTPQLSTIAPDKDEISRVAVDFLLSRIAADDDAPPPRERVTAHRLVVRESTAGR